MSTQHPPRARMSWRAALLIALALSGCRSDRARVEQGRLLELAEHIDRLRRADNADKRPALERLEALECHGVQACGLKDLCVRAYRVHQGALDAIESLRGAGQGGAGPSPSDLRARFGELERELEKARGLTESCAEEQVRTVRAGLM